MFFCQQSACCISLNPCLEPIPFYLQVIAISSYHQGVFVLMEMEIVRKVADNCMVLFHCIHCAEGIFLNTSFSGGLYVH